MRVLIAAVAFSVTAVAQTESWADPKTNLVWAKSDNGSAISLIQANQYCRGVALEGRRDWRLPTIEELQTLFGGSPDQRGFRTTGGIKLTGWAWSSTEGKDPGQGWALDFGDGARASVAAGDTGLNRALCVRGSRRLP